MECFDGMHYMSVGGVTYTMRLLSFRTDIVKSICVKEMTLLLFSFRHTVLLTVHTDHNHYRVVGPGVVMQKEPVTRFTHARYNTSNSV